MHWLDVGRRRVDRTVEMHLLVSGNWFYISWSPLETAPQGKTSTMTKKNQQESSY